MNVDSLYADLGAEVWSPVFNSTDVNDKLEYFNSVLLSLQNRHAPLQPVKRRTCLTSIKPWFNNDVKRAIIERDLAFAAYKDGLVPRQTYKQLRNAATNLIKRAKATYLNAKLDTRLGSKTIWKNLHSIGEWFLQVEWCHASLLMSTIVI